MIYTRRRVTLACDLCRHRKRRCDGEQPCSACLELNADCRYRNPPIGRANIDSSPAFTNEALSERLSRIEALLEEQNQRLSVLNDVGAAGGGRSGASDAAGQALAFDSQALYPEPYTRREVSSLPRQSQFQSRQAPSGSHGGETTSPYGAAQPLQLSVPDSDHAQFLIPIDHTAAPNTLLSLPVVQNALLSLFDRRGEESGRQGRGRGRGSLGGRWGSRGSRGSGSDSRSTSARGSSTSRRPPAPRRPSPPSSALARPGFSVRRTYFFEIEKTLPLPAGLDLVQHHRQQQHRHGPSNLSVNMLWLPPAELDTIRSDPSLLDRLSGNYFATVHPAAPLFRRSEFWRWISQASQTFNLETGVGAAGSETIEVAMYLCVWALGCLARVPDSRMAVADGDRLAHALFQPALRIIMHHAVWALGPPTSLKTCQALLLAAAYFSHIGRPLHNARMTHMASRFFLNIFNERKREGSVPESDEDLVRVFWVCFMLESDRIAEFVLPRSGVEPLADYIPLPCCTDTGESDIMIAFAAETSARRLLNRIHSLLYNTTGENGSTGVNAGSGPGLQGQGDGSGGGSSSSASTGGQPTPTQSGKPDANTIDGLVKKLAISTELNRQLEAWHSSIPEHLQPSLRGDGDGEDEEAEGGEDFAEVAGNAEEEGSEHDHGRYSTTDAGPMLRERARILRVRYYEARHIIHRPFVLGVAWQQQQQQQQQQMPLAVLDKCVVCVDSCVAYLRHVLPLLSRRSPYLWSLCQNCMACLVVLAVADTCPEIMSRVKSAAAGKARATADTEALPAPAPTTMPMMTTSSRPGDIGKLRDRVASKLRQWATAGSSLEAELRIVESLPVQP